jgi:formiminoglutamate deiminase
MGLALTAAAASAGVRMTLLDTCYLRAGISPSAPPLDATQQRFSDGDAASWAARASSLSDGPLLRIGAAIHSVRAVDPAAMDVVRDWAAGREAPLHAHVSEQPAENEACLAELGASPTTLLARLGVLGPRFTAVHATHLTPGDIRSYGASGSTCCFCPTTERDLADGIGPSVALRAAGAPISLGSDSHAVIDLFEEARAVELNQRLASLRRGSHSAASLLDMATTNGYRCLGWPDGGVLREGALADLVTVSLEGVRLGGAPRSDLGPAVVFAAAAADVTDVMVAGDDVVCDGRHVRLDVAAELAQSIDELWEEVDGA